MPARPTDDQLRFEALPPDAKDEFIEAVALTPQARARLWRFVLDLDLVRTYRALRLGVGEPLLRMLQDPGSVRGRVADDTWLRIVDVPAALAARRYLTEVDCVIGVRDPQLTDNDGRAGARRRRQRARAGLRGVRLDPGAALPRHVLSHLHVVTSDGDDSSYSSRWVPVWSTR